LGVVLAAVASSGLRGPNAESGLRGPNAEGGPPRRPVRILSIVAALMAVVVLAEGGARLLEPALRQPPLYADDTTAVKVLQMDRLGCADVVVAGNSMGRDAFDPTAFTRADPTHRRAYNASIDAASPALLRRWLIDEVVPRLDPALVVVTLASLDLNRNSAASRGALAAYDAAAMTAPGPVAAAGRALIRASALVRNRQQLRDPLAVAEAVRRRGTEPPAPRLSADGLPGVVGPSGEGESRRLLHYRHDATTRAFTRQQLLGGWELDDDQVRALDGLVTELRGRGTDVALVVLPVTRDYIDLHPRGRADAEEFRASVHAGLGVQATQAGGGPPAVPVIDLLDETPAALADDGAFADTHHLNQAGQSWFSTTLPDRLGPALTARSRCDG
jgi:hypothetical protein